MQESLNQRITKATKWSAITEILARVITPISSMVLARLLTPDAFGVVTTLTMVITFAEIFTDAGFQKYLVQHEFKDEQDQNESTNVAFWSNLILSLIVWTIICVFSESISTLVGNPGLGHVLSIACVAIPLASFSSIQIALYKRKLDFKTLFKVRFVGILIPLFITIPLAIILRSYWALVFGNIFLNVVNAVLLTSFSKWKPRLFYSFEKLKEMFSFSFWSMIEALSIWLTNYVDVFIVGAALSQYYLGLYKTSTTIVGQIIGLITGITMPVLFSSLSRLQNDERRFKKLFFRFQKYVSILVVPLGVGIFCFSELVTKLLLGSQWLETSSFIGLWGLTSSITVVLSYYCSEVYRAIGRPKLSVLAQWLHIIVLWPIVLISVKNGYNALCVARSLVRLEMVVVNLAIMYWAVKISPKDMINNIIPCIVSAFIMGVIGLLLSRLDTRLLYQLIVIGICVFVYFGFLFLFPTERRLIKSRIEHVLKRKRDSL